MATRDSGGFKNLNIILLNWKPSVGVTGHAKRVFGHNLLLSVGSSQEFCTKKNRVENKFPPGYTLFFFNIRILFFRPRLNILIFLPILD